MTQLQYYQSPHTLPFGNLALEEYLLETVREGSCILYLWQNRHTVVIGKNQNCWKECRVNELEQDGGYLARRLSGGGAVYHDLGNLNFTFLIPSRDYDVSRQLEVILRSVNSFGLDARKTGRNDITAGERKFSGNAFYHSQGRSYHHGTLLVNADMGSMSKYLNVSAEKLRSKGVDSVKSRVVNLSELCPEITIASLAERLIQAFGQVYGNTPLQISDHELDQKRISELTEKFSAWQWRFGRKIPFTWELEERFAWGDVQFHLQVESGIIRDGAVYSDAMDESIIGKIPALLSGCPFSSREISLRLDTLRAEGGAIVPDLQRLLGSQSF